MPLRITSLIFSLLVASPILAQTASELGPSTTQSGGPSTDLSQVLQPASPSNLQSLQGADAAGGGIPQTDTNQSLQSAGGEAEFKVLVGGEADETPKLSLPDEAGSSLLDWWPLGLTTVIMAAALTPVELWRRLFRASPK